MLADALGLQGVDREEFCRSAYGQEHDQPGTEPRHSKTVPAQLPADVTAFTGREPEQAALNGLLAGTSGLSWPVVISALSGTAGVGKTALAVHWAHTVAKRFPDGQLYVNLRGFGPAGEVMAPTEAVRGFLGALGVPPDRIPASLDTQTALYRSLLDGKRILIVLDNARDAEQVRPLLPGTPTAMAVVTSRNQLTGLLAVEGAHPLAINVLSTAEAHELLVHRLGERVDAEPDAVRQIITACAHLPLALSVAAARAQQTGFPLATLAADLNRAGRQLDALDAGDPASQVRAVFSWSTAALTPPAAHLFRLLGLHPGPDISTEVVASLIGQDVGPTCALLTELTRANLLDEQRPGRYTFHDLLRAYAGDLTHRTDPRHTRDAAVGRLLDHYIHTAYSTVRFIDPKRDPIPVPLSPPAPGTRPEKLADHATAITWLTAEGAVLLAAIRHLTDAGFERQVWQLTWSLAPFLHRQGRAAELASIWQSALQAAHRMGDPTAVTDAYARLAHVEVKLGHYNDAYIHLRHAIDLSTDNDDLISQGRVHHNLAFLCERLKRPHDALDHAQQALALFQTSGYRRGEAISLNAVGWIHAQLGLYAKAVDYNEQSLALHRQIGDRYGEAGAWDSLGHLHHHDGNYAAAIDKYRRALGLFRELGSSFHEAETLTALGETHHASRDVNAARTCWTHALAILTDLDHADAQTVRTRLAALVAYPTAS